VSHLLTVSKEFGEQAWAAENCSPLVRHPPVGGTDWRWLAAKGLLA